MVLHQLKETWDYVIVCFNLLFLIEFSSADITGKWTVPNGLLTDGSQ